HTIHSTLSPSCYPHKPITSAPVPATRAGSLHRGPGLIGSGLSFSRSFSLSLPLSLCLFRSSLSHSSGPSSLSLGCCELLHSYYKIQGSTLTASNTAIWR